MFLRGYLKSAMVHRGRRGEGEGGGGGGGKGPTKGALLNDETSFRERKSGRARSLMLRSIGAFLLLCKPHRALPGHRVFLHRPL